MDAENTVTSASYWLCPLYSFNCGAESIDLAEGIQIKAAPSKLRDYLKGRTSHLYGLRSNLSDVHWAAFLPYRSRNMEGLTVDECFSIGLEEHDRDRNSLVDLVTALRLYHRGRVVAGPLIIASIRNSEWSIGGSTIWTPVSELNFFQEEPEYVLNQSDVPKVNELLQSIRQWRKDGVLNTIDIALKRFHSAYHGNIEDRIIDQMIAFESLYLGNEQELTYKLALRTAFLLRKRKDYRSKIFANMKKAYKYRSRIVHGDNPPSRDELRVIVHNTGDYLRQSIKNFLFLLSTGMALNEIRNQLDENILTNGRILPPIE